MREQMIAHIERVPTLPRLLAQKGYLSLQTGKWWEGHHRRGGFTHGMTHGDPKRGGRHGDAGLAIGRQTTKPVLDFVDEAVAKQRPFFLWYAPMMPHLPHNPPERLLAEYQAKTESIHLARYWAMCEWFDETCGQLLDHLDQRGIAEGTLVLYVCDNGWNQLENRRGCDRRSKMSSFEGGVRTPIMVRWPGHVKPRRDDTTPVSAIDLVPTALAAGGFERSPALEGLSLFDRQAVEKRDGVFGATYGHDAVDVHDPVANLQFRWTIQGRWKLILPFRPNMSAAPVQLYDVVADPHEKKNLAAGSREVVERLRDRIDGWWSVDDPLPIRFPTPPPEAIDFDFAHDLHGWSSARQIGRLGLRDGHLAVEAKGNDPILVLAPCNIASERIARVRVRMSATAGTVVEFRWGTETTKRIDRGKILTVPLNADGQFHEYVFEVAKHPLWQGLVKRLRFDPTDAEGQVRIEWMRGER